MGTQGAAAIGEAGMVRALEVEARDGRRIWLRYSDGSTGEVDLSDVAGRGVFRAWDAPGVFEGVIAPLD